MPNGLFDDAKQAIESIQAERVTTDLTGTARRAVRATLWLGAHFGYQLKGEPMGPQITDELRAEFLEEINIVLATLREYDRYLPRAAELNLEDAWQLDSNAHHLIEEEILAVEYHHLRFLLYVTGLRK